MPGGWPRQRLRSRAGGLQPVAGRAPAARACQPPPLLMDSATCSTDTRCSAPAGLVPGCRPSARPPVWRDSPRYTLSRVPGPGSQTETMRSSLPSWKVSGYNRFHHFPPLRPSPEPWLPGSHCTSVRHPATVQCHCGTLKIFPWGLGGTISQAGLKQTQCVK